MVVSFCCICICSSVHLLIKTSAMCSNLPCRISFSARMSVGNVNHAKHFDRLLCQMYHASSFLRSMFSA
jgi:hypothetical protein